VDLGPESISTPSLPRPGISGLTEGQPDHVEGAQGGNMMERENTNKPASKHYSSDLFIWAAEFG